MARRPPYRSQSCRPRCNDLSTRLYPSLAWLLRQTTPCMLCAILTGCSIMRAPQTPMGMTVYHQGRASDTVVVLLPGAGDSAGTFHTKGFVDAVRSVAPGVDLVAADAHFGYYRSQTLVPRLQADVLQPLRQRYQHIVLAGISVGGAGAMAVARRHPQQIAGVLLFAPYMGSESFVEHFMGTADLCDLSLANGTPPPKARDRRGKFAQENLIWLQDKLCHTRDVDVFLAVGADDRLAPVVRYLARPLAPPRSFVANGGHSWTAWVIAAKTIFARAFAHLPTAASSGIR